MDLINYCPPSSMSSTLSGVFMLPRCAKASGISVLQTAQVLECCSHSFKHFLWNTCLHSVITIASVDSKLSIHIL